MCKAAPTVEPLCRAVEVLFRYGAVGQGMAAVEPPLYSSLFRVENAVEKSCCRGRPSVKMRRVETARCCVHTSIREDLSAIAI